MEYPSLLRELHAVLAQDLDGLRDLPMEQFMKSSLRDLGVDSLALTSLAVFVSRRFAIQLPDEFLFSDDVDCPECWARIIYLKVNGGTEMSGDVVFRGSRFVVVDDFLTPPMLQAARDWAGSLDMEFRPSVISESDNGSWRSANFKHGRELDDSVPHIKRIVAEFSRDEMTWCKGSEDQMSSAVWRYPVGSSLGWHNDWGGGRVGEFVLFLHPEWRPDWGGELVILDEAAEHASLRPRAGSVSIEEFVLHSRCLPTVVAPRPNRIVFLQAGTPHAVKRVEASWNGQERLTHTGFVSSREAINRQRVSRLAGVVE